MRQLQTMDTSGGGTAPEPDGQQADPNAPPAGVDPSEWERFRAFQQQETAVADAKANGSKSPNVDAALADFDSDAAKERGGFTSDEWADSGTVTIGDVTVSRAALAVTDGETDDATRAYAANRIDNAVRGNVSYRDSRPTDEQIAMMMTPVIHFAPADDGEG